MGLTVRFDGSGSSGGDNEPIVDYAWDFGDGTTGSGMVVSHTYPSAGDYYVSLTVTNACGRSDTSTQCVRVTEELPEICQYIVDNGGWNNLSWNAVLNVLWEYVDPTKDFIPFDPTWNETLGTLWYYVGNKENGNSLTGCDFDSYGYATSGRRIIIKP